MIFCLTETQLYLNEDTSDITTKFRSIAFGYSSNLFLSESSNFCSMSLVNIKKSTFLDKPVKIALLYRPPHSPPLFLQNMKSWIDEKKLRYFVWLFQYKCFVYRFKLKLKAHVYKCRLIFWT